MLLKLKNDVLNDGCMYNTAIFLIPFVAACSF